MAHVVNSTKQFLVPSILLSFGSQSSPGSIDIFLTKWPTQCLLLLILFDDGWIIFIILWYSLHTCLSIYINLDVSYLSLILIFIVICFNFYFNNFFFMIIFNHPIFFSIAVDFSLEYLNICFYYHTLMQCDNHPLCHC